ncbi:RNA polymerase recycling motor ATPase HelR [Raineyella sp. LH-20]|uniref:RNA polymerase recycling motor ATPase HelR n=1 Tax=Raineyella sp. LH-20 TaxID=3081204 RepID=UPI002953EED5|nr:RNA polymerase recycling motor ATPase HelR [Raineyella sp. LH-20]WOP19098.1 RNA polymerase recycling motor ATPase HelR [Raineyella sp. LH-20]
MTPQTSPIPDSTHPTSDGTRTIFDLPERLAAKADPALIAQDERHFATVARALDRQIAGLEDRLATLRRAPGGRGRQALDRDLEIHRLSARLRVLQRFGLDICLGRMVGSGDGEPVYVGRLGLLDAEGEPLLIDWRAPAAEPFFAATHGTPMGLVSRRRYRWSHGRVIDYWDEVFALEGLAGRAALDDQSAFIAGLGARRTARMRDVLATLQADQDAVIRAGSDGALVVDGGPGTGKTVVALHRAAYLLYADPRLGGHRGGVLFVGPHQPYLDYVADVLPDLGEDGVRTCTLRDLVPEGATAAPETDPEVARLKSSARMTAAVEPAVRLYEEPPTAPMTVETDWSDIRLSPADWAEAFEAPDPGTPHNEARDEVWDALLDILVDTVEDVDVPAEALRRSLLRNEELRSTFRRAWPILRPTDLVADLWAVPAYLRRCAPWLGPEELRRLRRPEGAPWTVADLPLLDAMRQRLGDPETSQRRQQREAALAEDRAYMDRVVEYFLGADDDPESSLDLLRRDSIRQSLVHDDRVPDEGADPLAGPFAHIVVDEAQELTDAEWQMVLRRCPSRSVTIVGDRTQARHGFPESWQERLARVGFDVVRRATLTINYRTPEEVMAAAEPVIRAVLPQADVPVSIRRGGVPVRYGAVAERDAILAEWLAEHEEGVACVVGDPTFRASDRIRSLAPDRVKGLEFDLVVLIDPDRFGAGIEGAVDRYVAMTRTTRQLVVLTGPGPA